MSPKVLSEYTPGPWHLESRDFGTAVVPDSDTQTDDDGCIGRHIAIVRSGLNGKQGLGYTGPNARLIAAAPEMLEALKRFNAIMDHMNESAQFEQLWYQLPAALLNAGHDAYKAISKAEGR